MHILIRMHIYIVRMSTIFGPLLIQIYHVDLRNLLNRGSIKKEKKIYNFMLSCVQYE